MVAVRMKSTEPQSTNDDRPLDAWGSAERAPRYGLAGRLSRLAEAGLLIAIGANLVVQVLDQFRPPNVSASRVHMALVGAIVILGFMERQRGAGRWLLHGLALVCFLATSYYFLQVWARAFPSRTDDYALWIFTSLLAALVIFYVYRFFGAAFALLGAVFGVYAFFAHLAPGVLQGPQNDFSYVFEIRMSRAMFGDPFSLGAEFIWLLLFWGQMLTAFGAGPAIAWVSRQLARSTAGGAALGAVLSSAIAGSFTGAGAQNVAITGPMTIPAMRRAGYSGEMAAAVEAVASNGAAITPPVLGTVAFIMANLLNMPFALIIVMTLLPALLWYLSIGLHLVAHARKHGLTTPDGAGEAPPPVSPWLLMRSALVGAVPVGVLVAMVASNQPLQAAVFYAFVTTVILGVALRVETRIGVLMDAAKTAAISASAVSLTLALLALVTRVMFFTGLGTRLDDLIEVVSGGYALVALLLMIVAAAVLAGPLPPVAMYFIMIITFAPVLTRMGAPFEASHFVAFYMGSLGTIVPPIAQSTLMASVIARTNYMRTNLEVLRLAWPLFVLPVIFIAAPELLLVAGGPQDPRVILTSLALAVLAYAFAALATVGWMFTTMTRPVRVLAAAVPLLVFVSMYTDALAYGVAGAGAAAIVTAWQWAAYLRQLRERGVNPFAGGAIAGVSVGAMRGLGAASGGLAALLALAWAVMALSPLAPGRMFRYASDVDEFTRAINLVFAALLSAAAGVAALLLLLAWLRKCRRSGAP